MKTAMCLTLVIVLLICAGSVVSDAGKYMPEIHEDDYLYGEYHYSPEDIKLLARLIFNEAYAVKPLDTPNGIITREYQMRCVAWCVLNRHDIEYGGETTIQGVVQADGQFAAHTWYDESYESVKTECEEIAKSVLYDWSMERFGYGGRTLPKEYIFFSGDGENNWFRDRDGNLYDWSLNYATES